MFEGLYMCGAVAVSAEPTDDGLPLAVESHEDERPAGFDLSQPHRTISQAETGATWERML